MSDENTCLICRRKTDVELSQQGIEVTAWRYECLVCGAFLINDSTEHYTIKDLLLPGGDEQVNRALLSHVVRKNQRPDGQPVRLSLNFVKQVLCEEQLPRPAEQADAMLLHVGDKTRFYGEPVSLQLDKVAAVIGAVNENGAGFVLDELVKRGWLVDRGDTRDYGIASCLITFEGWKEYESIKRGRADSRKAFMAMPFDPQAPMRTAYPFFQRAAERAGFQLVNSLLEEPTAGQIDDRLLVEIRTSKFLIADLTGRNSNVCWEAGFAEGLDKKVIYTCEESDFQKNKTPFDVNHFHTVTWKSEQPDKVEDRLTAVIRNTFPADAKMEDDV